MTIDLLRRALQVLFLTGTAAFFCGCQSSPVELEIRVHESETEAPIGGADIRAGYYAPLGRRSPEVVTSHTGENGSVSLQMVRKDYPLFIDIKPPGMELHRIHTYLAALIAHDKHFNPSTVTAKDGKLEVAVRAIKQ